MKRAVSYKKQFIDQSEVLKEVQVTNKSLQYEREKMQESIRLLQADNASLVYELGHQRSRVDALLYSLVLAQAHIAPMQRREFDNRGWEVTTTEKGLNAQFNRDQVKIAS